MKLSQTTQNVVDYCFWHTWMERRMPRGKYKARKLLGIIAVTFAHANVTVMIVSLMKQWNQWRLKNPHRRVKHWKNECFSFTSEKKKIIENELFLLRDSLAEDACLLSADHSLGFTTDVVKQIVENCENMKTEEDILEKVDIWNVNLAGKVLAILQNVSTN